MEHGTTSDQNSEVLEVKSGYVCVCVYSTQEFPKRLV
jgi:hypothetical protein